MKPENKKKYNEKTPKRRRISNIAYLATVLIAFESIGLALVVFPRSTVSITEKRELKTFPELTADSYFSGEFTKSLSEWFSDTVPFRDELTGMSTQLRELRGFRQGGIKLHGVGESKSDSSSEQKPEESSSSVSSSTSSSVSDSSSSSSSSETHESSSSSETSSSTSTPNTDDAVKITNNGIAVVGTRALMLYGGSFSVSERYANVMNKYKQAMPNVNVYSMIIPTSCEFYSPDEVKAYCGSEKSNIEHVNSFLKGVVPVDAYSALQAHTNEDIYLRTDHHWAPLGAYYAAQAFAKTAGVPFKDISEYERQVVHGYVGTMYGYTEDIVLKNNPEDFVYYVPKNAEYTTTYYEYTLSGDAEYCEKCGNRLITPTPVETVSPTAQESALISETDTPAEPPQLEEPQETKPETKICRFCGAEMSASAHFCRNCGKSETEQDNSAEEQTPASTKFCGFCGAEIPADNRFCGMCGKEMPTEKICAKCGAVIPPENNFCGKCGTKYGSDL